MKTSSRFIPIPSSSSFRSWPGPADERQALAVLLGPRRLADEHQVGVGVAGPEDRLGAGLVQRAFGAGLDLAVEADELGPARLGGDAAHPGAGPFFRGAGASPAARFFLSAASRSWCPASRSRRRDSSDRTPAPRGWRPGGETSDIRRRARGDPQLGQATSAASLGTELLEPTPALLALELIDAAWLLLLFAAVGAFRSAKRFVAILGGAGLRLYPRIVLPRHCPGSCRLVEPHHRGHCIGTRQAIADDTCSGVPALGSTPDRVPIFSDPIERRTYWPDRPKPIGQRPARKRPRRARKKRPSGALRAGRQRQPARNTKLSESRLASTWEIGRRVGPHRRRRGKVRREIRRQGR